MKLFRGFVILGFVLPAFAQYAGPAILSRGEAPGGMTRAPDGFTLSLTLTSEYTNGLIGIDAQNSAVALTGEPAFGAGLVVGATGGHTWGHTHLNFGYSGSFKDYSRATTYRGSSQGLSFDLIQQFSPRLALDVRESAGMYSRFLPATVSEDSSVPLDSAVSSIPTTDFYNNRTVFNTTQANLTWQQTARLSFDVGGSYFLYSQQASALYGAQGEVAMADAQYRLSPHATIGAEYSFAHFTYTHGFGGAFIHTGLLTAAWRMDRSTEFSLFVGPSRTASSFERSAPIDPAFLAILCPSSERASCPVSSSVVISNNTDWGPDYGVRASKIFLRGTAYVNAGKSTTPGNGLFLTSRTTMASVGYGYSGLRSWSAGVAASYMSSTSLGNAIGRYQSLVGSYHMSRHIAGPISFVSSFNATQYRSDTVSAYNRLIYTASVGFGYSTGERPVPFF